eukprot:CAMPEP_0184247856 /NCGR_PEP_ID=MMETSP0977-20130417/2764_1 /TAXON_ID=483370 /ORGANISM="non described non described, Strain CCMP2097" /LENGTH=61 /DNA_ID=CAMNT_0026553187 /DNA_START=193 /DNA_END=379 /DNA_ORIENTATION=+
MSKRLSEHELRLGMPLVHVLLYAAQPLGLDVGGGVRQSGQRLSYSSHLLEQSAQIFLAQQE